MKACAHCHGRRAMRDSNLCAPCFTRSPAGAKMLREVAAQVAPAIRDVLSPEVVADVPADEPPALPKE